MSENLPALPPNDEGREAFNERCRLSALVESAMKFRVDAGHVLDEVIREMLLTLHPVGGVKFHTPQGRNAMILLAVGDDAVGSMTDILNSLTTVEEEQSPPPDPENDPDFWKK